MEKTNDKSLSSKILQNNSKLLSQKGITLIALVITIVITVILGGISVALVLGENGIITRAKNVKTLTEETQANEQAALAELTNKMEEKVNDKTNPIEQLINKVQIGDYVAYDATNNYSYESPVGTGPSHGNGYSAQTFTSSSSIKWRVLSKDETTGEIVLISEAPINTDANEVFYIKGGIGYLYAEEELNRICSIYGHGVGGNTTKTFNYETGDLVEGTTTGTLTGSGARSINVDDINTITGFNSTTFSGYETPYTNSIYYPTKTTTTGYSTSTVSRTDIYTYYNYIGSTYITDTTSNIYQMLFRDTANANNIKYWLASRCVSSNYSLVYFGVRIVNSGGVGNYGVGGGYSSTFYENSFSSGVRPVVYLQSNILTSGKDASGAWKIN